MPVFTMLRNLMYESCQILFSRSSEVYKSEIKCDCRDVGTPKYFIEV